MWNINLSKEFVIIVVVILAVWFLGPRIMLSTHEKTWENQEQAFLKQLEDHQAKVSASVKTLPIPDENLLACIQAAADERGRINPLNSGAIDDVRELPNLYCPRRKIASLIGIEHLRNLEFLDVSYNSISNISPLASLSNLRSLRLNDNPVIDIRPLRNLAGLTDLSLPNMPDTPCDDIKNIIGNVRANINSIHCRKASDQSVSQQHDRRDNSQDSYRLNYQQEREMMEYELNRQRR